ncbi:DNA-binding transcriptional regulator, XRE-family HTH domain [Thermosyntropha lipolytica DSM 11003]|uniref:DNA-binding transcriptional regulator, XRE-family HTH domain n=1 Tax=Thermosyntropha lipolytica DSM 11003 TaxID=1123382 RepID=A0A1M5SB27_9FIRM|nr:helix-turn-helix transcriptional regulator [Thermosyntropha lipolytica]SHH35689.1 DNA-binding transcriptional regulator, XRE-family HTH domain [Thermosyntropha lipolytica DSM 11003]
MMKRIELKNPYDIIERLAGDEEKKRFELDDILFSIAAKLLDYRIKNNLSQTQLAKKLGVSQAMISKLESGEYNPTIEKLWDISQKMGWRFTVKFDETPEAGNEEWDIKDKSVILPDFNMSADINIWAKGA